MDEHKLTFGGCKVYLDDVNSFCENVRGLRVHLPLPEICAIIFNSPKLLFCLAVEYIVNTLNQLNSNQCVSYANLENIFDFI